MSTSADVCAQPTANQRHSGDAVNLEAIPSAVWGGLGAGSMVSLLYYLLATGRLVQSRVVDKMLADKDAQLSRVWAANDSLVESVRKYAVSAETTAHAFHEVERIAAKEGDE